MRQTHECSTGILLLREFYEHEAGCPQCIQANIERDAETTDLRERITELEQKITMMQRWATTGRF